MKRVLFLSVHEACEYALEHYYPFGMRDFAIRQDTYAVISIQDSHCGGFGVSFAENEFCKGVLTLQVDDIEREVEGAVLFDDDHAEQIIEFILSHRTQADTLLVHCYAGQSRSRAVAAFAAELLGQNSDGFFTTGSPNMHICNTLRSAWIRRMLSGK